MKNYPVYSKKLNKVFDTVAELEAAEKELSEKELAEKKKKEERSARAKEVEEAYKKVDEAKKVADDLLEAFIKDYGSYHTSVKEVKPTSVLDWFFDNFLL